MSSSCPQLETSLIVHRPSAAVPFLSRPPADVPGDHLLNQLLTRVCFWGRPIQDGLRSGCRKQTVILELDRLPPDSERAPLRVAR